MHTGCPVLKGVKWTATKWIHARPFRREIACQRDAGCSFEFLTLFSTRTHSFPHHRRLLNFTAHPDPRTQTAETFGLLEPSAADPGICSDALEHCEDWAKDGQCQKNPDFMLGAGETAGSCRKACGACKPCAAGDVACYNKLRKAAHYLEVEDFEAYLFPAIAGEKEQ